MGIIIDRHFVSELFDEKKVIYNNKIYLQLFNKIWPEVENFRGFLSASDVSLKIEFAKKIYKSLSLSNFLFLPDFTFLNVLNDQINNPKKDVNNYVPQDHVLHSVHLYVLGIYIFFNSKTFNTKILMSGSNSYFKKVADFILKWQAFSIHHDIGYYFEDKNLANKNFDEYKNIYIHLIHCLIIKNYTQTLTLKALTERSKEKFTVDSIENSNGIWYNVNNGIVDSNDIINNVTKFVGANCISGLTNDEHLINLLPLINDEYLVAIFNEFGECISLIIRKKLRIIKIWSKDNFLVSSLFINDMLCDIDNNYKIKYFINGVSENKFWLKAIKEDVVIDKVYQQLPSDIQDFITMNYDKVDDIAIKINNWIEHMLPIKNTLEEIISQHLSSCLEICCIENLNNIINEQIKDVILTKENLKGVLKEIKKKNTIDTAKKIYEDAATLYDKTYGISYMLVKHYTSIFEEIQSKESTKKDCAALDFITAENSKVLVDKFKYEKDNKLHEKLFNSVLKLVSDYNLKIEDLLGYKPSYAPYDHGIISACLLFQSAALLIGLKQSCKDLLPLVWNDLNTNIDANIDYCADIVFSVMMHNIYCKKDNNDYGLEYHHDIDINPFAYFCSFCDTIQKWGRPKLIDLSKVNIPDINYLEDELDINISKDKISISCLEKNVQNIKKIICESNSFLPGISNLVAIEII